MKITSFKIPKPKPPTTVLGQLRRRPDYMRLWTGKLAEFESWKLQPFTTTLTQTSALDRKRALEFSKNAIEVVESDGLFTVLIGGADNVFVEVESGEAAVAIASGINSVINALIGQKEHSNG